MLRTASLVAGVATVLVAAMPAAGAAAPASAAADSAAAPYVVQGDAIALPLDGLRGDAVRGRAIVASRQLGLCLLCHTGPIAEERFQGNLAPDLQGAGLRWSVGQLRLRIVDSRHLNPETIMPSYYNNDGLQRVAGAFQGKTIFSAQQVEDVVAWLATLREERP